MKTTIHFIRHSIYENPNRIVPGRMPGFHLSDIGKDRAKKVGQFFSKRPIKFIYTSPIERAFETANIISEYIKGAKVVHSYELIEIDAKPWQAYKYEELFINNYYESFLNDPESVEVPENLNTLANRMGKFCQELCKKHRGQEIICVSHDYPIVALKLSLENKALQLLKSVNASMG